MTRFTMARPIGRRTLLGWLGASALALQTRPVWAATSTKSLAFRSTHTGETLSCTYWDATGYRADALSDIRREEAISKVREYQEARTARLDEDLGKMEDWLELTPYQVEEMRGVLLAQYEREDEQRRMWEDGEGDEILEERKASDGALFWEECERILAPEQYATFFETITGQRDEK